MGILKSKARFGVCPFGVRKNAFWVMGGRLWGLLGAQRVKEVS